MITHGRSRYVGHGCRCQVCCNANRVYLAARTVQRKAYVAANGLPSSVVHGRSSTYTNWGCRCDDCRAAWAKYSKTWKRAKAWP